MQKSLQPINVLTTSHSVFNCASLKPCILFKLLFRRRSDRSSGQVFIAMVGAVRPGKNKRAAKHCFTNWYDAGKANMNGGCIQCSVRESVLREQRKSTPHTLLLFLLNVLQCLVDTFWQTSAASDPYVRMCVTTMGKCPPCIIGLLVYLTRPTLSPVTASAFPPTSKDRIFWSELGRSEARLRASASASASMSATAANDDDESAAVWSRLAEKVMQHLVWPAVRAGEITQAPNAHVDIPTWWREGIAPILEDERVYSLHWKGGKRKAKSCWTHVCAELAPYEFARVERREDFRQKNA